VATLAANVAHGWPHGPVGAAVAAWPAASLVGSYELLLWLIRTAAAGVFVREPVADQASGSAGRQATGLRLVSAPDLDVLGDLGALGGSGGDSHRASGPGQLNAGHLDRPAGQETIGLTEANRAGAIGEGSEKDINVAAVAAYRASLDTSEPLSERKLAAMFGRTSRRWARNRMAEAHQISAEERTAQ
jgi:hypothetical protein